MMSILLTVALAVVAQEGSIEWINSPEAYFATPSERAEWFRLKDDAEREAFKKRYWLIRNPTPNTEKNEFKEVILDRIRKADAKFSIHDGPLGSLTAQGQLYIVFGPPATIQTRFGGGVLRPGAFSAEGSTVAEGTDTTATWIYDTHRTPRLLHMLGLPELRFTIVIEPTRRRDVLQTPGLFDQYREVLAKRSIVNPIAVAMELRPARLDAAISSSVQDVLRNAPLIGRSGEGIVFSAADFWRPGGSVTIVSFSLPNAEERAMHLMTYGQVRAGDRVVATIAQPFSELLRVDMPPGSYELSFALVDDRTNVPLTAVAAPLHVLDPSADFDVSSLLLSGEPSFTAASPFFLGKIALRPHVDLLFSHNESAWYFAVIRSASGAKDITAEVQIRRGGKPLAARGFTPSMQQIAPGLFLLGEELPLHEFSAGDYSLYLVVHGAGATEVRRADFRVGS